MECSSIWVFLISHDYTEVIHFWQDYLRRNIAYMSCVSHHSYMMSMCFISGDVNFDHSVKVMSSRFLQCKFIIFPLEIHIFLVGRNILCLLILCPLISTSVDGSYLQHLLNCGVCHILHSFDPPQLDLGSKQLLCDLPLNNYKGLTALKKGAGLRLE